MVTTHLSPIIGDIARVFAIRSGALRLAASVAAAVMLASCGGGETVVAAAATDRQALGMAMPATRPTGLDAALAAELTKAGFTGAMGLDSTLELRLGRTVDPKLANLGRMLFFDTIGGLHDDNACAGCHSPSAGMGDTQSIAIGIQNNGIVGPARSGPRNQRRSPMVINTPFFYKLMWNGRFNSLSEDPFDNSKGFEFTPPEGRTKFPANDPIVASTANAPLPRLASGSGSSRKNTTRGLAASNSGTRCG